MAKLTEAQKTELREMAGIVTEAKFTRGQTVNYKGRPHRVASVFFNAAKGEMVSLDLGGGSVVDVPASTLEA